MLVVRNTSVLRTYKFYDIFPSDISAIELSYDTVVTPLKNSQLNFQVQYFTVGETEESSANGSFDETVEVRIRSLLSKSDIIKL